MTHTHPTVAIIGATGLVGQTMIDLLREGALKNAEVRLLASSSSAGRIVQVGAQAIAIEALGMDAFKGVDIALFAMGADLGRMWAPIAVESGAIVIDNSSAWRMDPKVPLVVAGVNEADLADHRGIVANPNCSTMQLAPLLATLRDIAGLERVVVDTYQAVSGTGAPAVAELTQQVAAHANGGDIVASVYPHPIAFNAIPEIDTFLPDGYTREERKVIDESRKILHLPDLRVSCTAVRIPVFIGHSEAVHVETTIPLSAAAARAAFAATAGVIVEDEPLDHRYPLATLAAGRHEVFVGRIRRDISIPDGRGLAFWVVADNLRKGAAANAVDLAEILLARN